MELLPQIDCDPSSAAELLPLVYQELRRLAAQKMSQELPGHTLQATALVHEAYLRLVSSQPLQSWESRGQFFAAAAEAMRRILVERARQKKTQKRGNGLRRLDIQLEGSHLPMQSPPDEVLELNDALEKLAQEDPFAAKVAELRVFAGLTLDEIAASLRMSRTTIHRQWIYARAWLRAELCSPLDIPQQWRRRGARFGPRPCNRRNPTFSSAAA